MRLSFSQLGTYENCKLQYYYSYVLKLEQKDVETKYMHFGSCVHDTIEQYYNERMPWMYYFDKNWNKYKLEGRMDRELGMKCVEHALKLNLKPTAVEKRFIITNPIHFLGIFDVFDELNLKVYDWKTSTYSEDKVEEYKKQLLTYAWLYYMKTGEFIKECGLVFLKMPYGSKNSVFTWTFTESEIMGYNNYIVKAYDEISEFRNTIHEEKKIERNINGCHWCGYKYRCPQYQNELHFILRIRGSRFYVIEGQITPLLQRGIDKVFSYEKEGAYYIEKATDGKWDGTVRFWWKKSKSLPLGFLERFKKLLYAYAKQQDVGCHIDVINDHEVDNDKPYYSMPEKLNTIELRKYQKEAVETAIEKKIGFLQCPTGAGKTVIATEIIRRLDQKTLFVVDRKELLTQAKDTFEKELGLVVGLIGEGKCETENQITVATIQSLSSKIGTLAKFLERISCVIVDESHKAAAKSYTQLFSYLKNAEHRIGITATVKRDDGDEMQFQSILGDVIYDIELDTLVNEGFLLRPQVFFAEYEKDSEFSRDYNEYYTESIVNSAQRNAKCIEIASDLAGSGLKVLILTKRIEHTKYLFEELKKEIKSTAMIIGETNKKEREAVFDLFKNGDMKVLIGTQSIFSEGIDIKSLTCVINAAANKGEVKTIQTIGRVMRTLVGKEKAYYIDFYDQHLFGIQHSSKRKKILEDMGYEVKKWR